MIGNPITRVVYLANCSLGLWCCSSHNFGLSSGISSWSLLCLPTKQWTK